MKEHSLFLKAGFTPGNAELSNKAEWFKVQFEKLLANAVSLSNGTVSQSVLDSEEIVTQFTLNAEKQTSRFTGILINTEITNMELKLSGNGGIDETGSHSYAKIKALNRRAIQLLNGLIEFKEYILTNVKNCRLFTMNYPLLIEHILREAKLYRRYITALENGTLNDELMRDTEQFWNRIMMEHAMFIRGLLDPSEDELIKTSNTFANEYAELLEQARRKNDIISSVLNFQAKKAYPRYAFLLGRAEWFRCICVADVYLQKALQATKRQRARLQTSRAACRDLLQKLSSAKRMKKAHQRMGFLKTAKSL